MRSLGENTQSLRLHGLEQDECMLCFHTLKQMLYQNTKLSNETDMEDGKALFLRTGVGRSPDCEVHMGTITAVRMMTMMMSDRILII